MKDFLKQLYLTFSKKPSDLSSKKIERFISFSTATGMIAIYYLGRQLCWKCTDVINVNDVLLLSGALFMYGGYNTMQIRKDQNNEPKSE